MIRLVRDGERPQVPEPTRVGGRNLALLATALFASALLPMDHSPDQMRQAVAVESVGGHAYASRATILRDLINTYIKPGFAGEIGRTRFNAPVERRLVDAFYSSPGDRDELTTDLSPYMKGFQRLQLSWTDIPNPRSHIMIEGVYDLAAIPAVKDSLITTTVRSKERIVLPPQALALLIDASVNVPGYLRRLTHDTSPYALSEGQFGSEATSGDGKTRGLAVFNTGGFFQIQEIREGYTQGFTRG